MLLLLPPIHASESSHASVFTFNRLSYKLGLTASQVVGLIGLLLVFASQKNCPFCPR